MEEKIIHFLKKPQTLRSIYFMGSMVISCCIGIIGTYSIINDGNNPIIEIPKKPIPLACRYKTQTVLNPADFIPAEIPATTLAPAANQSSLENNQQTISPVNSQAFVASKTGEKYYPAGCSGINRIKPENRVYFSSEQDAQDKGYTRTSTCK